MDKKCLIINGSPKLNGNTHFLINEFIKNTNFKIDIINTFPISNNKGISSCLDCGGCSKIKLCCVNDDFKKVLNDDYDFILVASPIYQSNLPGPMINLLNRFNFEYNNKISLNYKHIFKPKKAGLILVGGGGACKPLQGISNEDLPIKQSKYIFKKLNAQLYDENIILCLNTDEVNIKTNQNIIDAVIKMAKNI